MSSSHPVHRPAAPIVCGMLLVVVMGTGLATSVYPDFDATFGIEAYRRLGWATWAFCSALLIAILLSARIAARIENVAADAVSRLPRVARLPLFVVAMVAVFCALPDTSLSGDGMGVVYRVCRGVTEASSPLTCAVQTWAVRAVPADPSVVMRAFSVVVGAGFVALSVWAGRVLFQDPRDRAATTALLVTSGSAALFFGSVEAYALPVTGVLAFLVLALRQLDGVDPRPWPALALGVLVTVHGSTLALLPVLALVVWRTASRTRALRDVAAALVAFVTPVLFAVAVLFFTTWGGELPGGGSEALGNVLGAQGQSPLLPLFASPYNVNLRYAMLEPEHLVGLANLLLLVCPAGLLLATLGRAWSPRAQLVTLALVCLVGLALIWNVTYTLRRDWDLFATIGVPLALLGALRSASAGRAPGRAVRIAALGAYAFVPLVLANAGDDVQRRTYAEEVVGVYERLIDAQEPRDDAALRERIAAGLHTWREELRRRDPHGVVAMTRAAEDARTNGDAGEVARLVDTVLAVEPDNGWALVTRGQLLYREERHDAARAALEASLPVTREDLRPRARRYLARIALAEGRTDDAVRQLERGLHEEMSWEFEALAALQMLATLHRDSGRIALSEAIERMARRRRDSGLK